MVHIKKKKKKPYREKNRPEFRGWGDRRAETTSRMRASSLLEEGGGGRAGQRQRPGSRRSRGCDNPLSPAG